MSRNTDHENVGQIDAQGSHQSQEGHGYGRDRACGNAHGRCYDRDGQRPFRAGACSARHFGDDREHRIGHMRGSGEQREEEGHDRSEKGHVGRMAAQDPGGQGDQVIKSSGGLQGSGRADHRNDHQNDVDGGAGGPHSEYEGQDRESQTSHDAQSEASHSGAHHNGGQHDRQFQPEHTALLELLCVD